MSVVDGKPSIEGCKLDGRSSTIAIGVVEEIASGRFVANALSSSGEGSAIDKGSRSQGACRRDDGKESCSCVL